MGNMAAADLAQIADVDIDSDGVFKYVLIRVHSAPPSEAPAGESKEIVRGYKWAEYHGEGGAGGRFRGGAEGRGGVDRLRGVVGSGAGLRGVARDDPVPGLNLGWLRESGSWRARGCHGPTPVS